VLGKALYYPSFASFLRYSQELYYLIEIKPYRDWALCWAALFATSVVFRAIAFVSLVAVESAQTSGIRKENPFGFHSSIWPWNK